MKSKRWRWLCGCRCEHVTQLPEIENGAGITDTYLVLNVGKCGVGNGIIYRCGQLRVGWVVGGAKDARKEKGREFRMKQWY